MEHWIERKGFHIFMLLMLFYAVMSPFILIKIRSDHSHTVIITRISDIKSKRVNHNLRSIENEKTQWTPNNPIKKNFWWNFFPHSLQLNYICWNLQQNNLIKICMFHFSLLKQITTSRIIFSMFYSVETIMVKKK